VTEGADGNRRSPPARRSPQGTHRNPPASAEVGLPPEEAGRVLRRLAEPVRYGPVTAGSDV